MDTKGMLIQGVLGSSALDKSGEMLDIAGIDISDWKKSKVTLNWEHQSKETDEHHHSAADIVGKVIYVKKIFKESDCENDQQLKFWNEVRLPFLYGIARLFDAAGHKGAQELAAIIRDCHANNEPILTAFSVEGTKLEIDKGHIKKSILRAVAVTVKECNATAQSGLVSDPEAPEGFDKQTDAIKDVEKDIQHYVKVEKSQIANENRLSSFESSISPFMGDLSNEKLKKSIKALLKFRLYKALTAGGQDVAPSQLTGGSALQVSNVNVNPKHKKRAEEVYSSYTSSTIGGGFGNAGGFDKTELRSILKNELPEVSDEFLDYFVNLAEETEVKKKGKSFELIVKMESLTVDLLKATQDIKRPSVFEYYREGMSKPHLLQAHGANKFSLDGNELTEDEISKILENVNNNIAIIRYKKKSSDYLAKAEEYISELHSLPDFMNKEKPGTYALLEFHFLDNVINDHGPDAARTYLRSIGSNLTENADCRVFMLNNHMFLLYSKDEDQLYLTLRTIRDKLSSIVPVGGQYPAQFSAGIGNSIGLAHKALQQTEHRPGMVYSLVFGSEGAIPIDCAPEPVLPSL